jgi:hypothetical protein
MRREEYMKNPGKDSGLLSTAERLSKENDVNYESPIPKWFIVFMIMALAFVIFATLGYAYPKEKHQAIVDSVAERSALMKLKQPVKMASEQAILATVWNELGESK